jgi:hypothetical protein
MSTLLSRRQSKRSAERGKRLIYWPLILVAGINAGLLVGVWRNAPRPETLAYEVGKACIQVLAVILVGFLVSQATFALQHNHEAREREAERAREERFHVLERARDERLRKDELLRSVLSDSLAAYNAVKKARRVLRARIWACADGDHVDAKTYDEWLTLISETQLQFEHMKKAAPLMVDERVDRKTLDRPMAVIERYLGELVTEYERSRRLVAHAPGGIAISELPKLNAFIDPEDKARFTEHVARPIHGLINQLRTALLTPVEARPDLS